MKTGLQKIRFSVFFGVIMLAALAFSVPALADWNTDGNKITYTDDDGEKAVGLTKIGKYTYYFNKKGVLQTGWVETEDGIRYFQKVGKTGYRYGSMLYDGIFEVDGESFGFDEEGVVLHGLTKLGSAYYYFNTSAKAGVRGHMAASRFKDLPDGRRIYLQEKGKMARNKWVVDHTYYMGDDGGMLKNTVTPDNWLLKKNGKADHQLSNEFFQINGNWYFFRRTVLKDKVFLYQYDYYYVDKDGIRQTGWITWKGHKYYFRKTNGKAMTGVQNIKGKEYSFNEKGQLEEDDDDSDDSDDTGKGKGQKILILCGHGQGDPGAVGCNGKYQEYIYTRDFGKRIYKLLKKNSTVDVTLYNTNYDMYQQIRSTVSGRISYTGSGSRKSKLKKVLKKNSRIPDLTQYDYALEIHFNATGYSSKDPNGDGVKKGTGIYVNSYKSYSACKIDRKIISAISGCGIKVWAAGVNKSSGLTNAKTFNELGVNYTLLETCFIDDWDDMKFYLKKRDILAKQVAKVLVKYA